MIVLLRVRVRELPLATPTATGSQGRQENPLVGRF